MQYFTLTLSTDQFGMLATSEITYRLIKVKNRLHMVSMESFFDYPENQSIFNKIVADVKKIFDNHDISVNNQLDALTTLYSLK